METEITLRNVLQEIAKENNYEPNEINIKSISSEGANYTSELFTAKIKSPEKDDLDLFAKVAVLKERMRAEMGGTDIFETERYFYSRLSKLFEEWQTENDLEEDEKFQYPKCYGFNEVQFEETVVLEDLALKGYLNWNRFEPVDWEFASAAMTELAKFHALCFAFQDKYPEEFEELAKKTQMEFQEKDENKKTFEDMTKSALKCLDQEQCAKLGKWLQESSYLKNIQAFYGSNGEGTPVMIHGDFRPSNMMYKKTDGKLHLMTLDFQTMRSGRPVCDIIYFIISGTDREFRRNHLSNLRDHYYTQLRTSLEKLKLDISSIYPRSRFDEDWERLLPYGLIVSLYLLPLITVNVENAPNMNDDNADVSSFVIKPNELFAIRIRDVVDDYIEWGILN